MRFNKLSENPKKATKPCCHENKCYAGRKKRILNITREANKYSFYREKQSLTESPTAIFKKSAPRAASAILILSRSSD